MTGRRTSPLAAALLGAFLGVVIACMAKGALFGWGNGYADWAWLSALFGMLGGPLLLGLDFLALTGKGPPWAELVVLPWAGMGAVIGAIAGLLSNKEP